MKKEFEPKHLEIPGIDKNDFLRDPFYNQKSKNIDFQGIIKEFKIEAQNQVDFISLAPKFKPHSDYELMLKSTDKVIKSSAASLSEDAIHKILTVGYQFVDFLSDPEVVRRFGLSDGYMYLVYNYDEFTKDRTSGMSKKPFHLHLNSWKKSTLDTIELVDKENVSPFYYKSIIDPIFDITQILANDALSCDELKPYLKLSDFLKPLCLTMMFAGLRTGEVLALKWQDVDFEKKTISIERGLTLEPKFDNNGKVIKRITIISDTKTACSKRTVPMPDILINALSDYAERQSEISLSNGINLLDKNCFVFANDDGSFRTYSGTHKIFNRFLKKYDLEKYNIHFHGLRHTYSNMLFEADQNPKVIQALLGHKDVKTTISTYNSVDKSYFDKATNVLNEQFKENKNEKIANLVEEDDLDELIQMLEEKRKRKRQKDDFEM